MKKIILIVVVVLIITFLYFNGLLILTRLKFPSSKYPLLYKTPVVRQLSCSSSATSGNPELSYYGVRIKAPWVDINDRKEKKGFTQVVFDNNKYIVFFDEKQEIKDTFIQGDIQKTQKLKEILGDDVLSSNYALHTALLGITPSFFYSFGKNPTVQSLLLVLKATFVPPTSSGNIYNFETDKIKGFQYGDPVESRLLTFEFYDINDRLHSLAVVGANQQEIDCILSSIEI